MMNFFQTNFLKEHMRMMEFLQERILKDTHEDDGFPLIEHFEGIYEDDGFTPREIFKGKYENEKGCHLSKDFKCTDKDERFPLAKISKTQMRMMDFL